MMMNLSTSISIILQRSSHAALGLCEGNTRLRPALLRIKYQKESERRSPLDRLLHSRLPEQDCGNRNDYEGVSVVNFGGHDIIQNIQHVYCTNTEMGRISKRDNRLIEATR